MGTVLNHHSFDFSWSGAALNCAFHIDQEDTWSIDEQPWQPDEFLLQLIQGSIGRETDSNILEW